MVKVHWDFVRRGDPYVWYNPYTGSHIRIFSHGKGDRKAYDVSIEKYGKGRNFPIGKTFRHMFSAIGYAKKWMKEHPGA